MMDVGGKVRPHSTARAALQDKPCKRCKAEGQWLLMQSP
jgi:hypothetical protein